MQKHVRHILVWLATLTILVAHDATAELLFPAEFYTYTSGTTGLSNRVAIADVDADGAPELVVATHGPLRVMKFDAAADVVASTDFDSLLIPADVLVANLDADTLPDVAAISLSSNALFVFKNVGNGNFAAPTSYDAGDSANAMALADLNGDDVLDAVITSASAFVVSILMGNGDGSFAPRTEVPISFFGSSVAAADIDADGDADLLVAQGQLSILRNQGDGTFGTAEFIDAGGSAVTAVAVADLNDDAIPDIAVANAYFTVCVMLGLGGGNFAPPVEHCAGKHPSQLVIADVDADGHLDLIATSRWSGEDGGPITSCGWSDLGSVVSVFLGAGDGSFAAARNFWTLDGPQDLAVGDVTGDGLVDLAVVGVGLTVALLPGTGGGDFGTRVLQPGPPTSSITAADVNGDSRPDLALTEVVGGQERARVLLGNGNGSFSESASLPLETPYWACVRVADLDGGAPDLVVAEDSLLAIYPGNGDGSFGARVEHASASYTVGMLVAAVDADATLDVVVVGVTGEVFVHRNDGSGSFMAPITFAAVEEYAYDVAAGDLDADGNLDLAVSFRLRTSPHTAGVSVLLGNGDGSFGPPTILNVRIGSVPEGVAIADLNDDDALDLVVASYHRVSVLLGNGDGTFGPLAEYEVGLYSQKVRVADVDGDGRVDLAVSTGENTISVLLGNGDGTFAHRSDYGTGLSPSEFVAADLNNDGSMDLAVANRGADGYGAGLALLLGSPPLPVHAEVPRGRLDMGLVHRRGSVDVWYRLAEHSTVNLRLFDVRGRALRVLDRGPRGAGEHWISWPGTDDHGRQLARGIYFVRLSSGRLTRVEKCVLIR